MVRGGAGGGVDPAGAPGGSVAGPTPRGDLVTMVLAIVLLMTVSAVGAAVQTVWALATVQPTGVDVPVLRRMVANLAEGVALAATLAALGAHRRTRVVRHAVDVVAAGMVAAAVRLAVQHVLNAYIAPPPEFWWPELASGLPSAWLSGAVGLVAVRARRRVRAEADAAARAAVAREMAMGALADEEVRVRREVAEGLHGTAQQRLVLVVAGLDQVLREVDGVVAPDVTVELRELRDRVEQVRAADIRQASRLLYPHQIEVGLVAAVRAQLSDVPVAVSTHLTVDPAVRALDEPGSCRTTRGERLLVARVVEEAIGNALRHGAATDLAVTVGLDRGRIAVTVADDGCGLVGTTAGGSGLARLAERLALAGGDLLVEPGPAAGVVVRALVPVGALAAPDPR